MNIPAILAMFIPIVAVVAVFWSVVNKQNNHRLLRQSILQNQTDKETAELLLREQKKEHNPYSTLRTGCLLIGIGVFAVVNYLLFIDTKSIYFWLSLGFGAGVGLLVSFALEQRLRRKQQAEDAEE